MSRAYLVYILMFLLAGGGLWVIFTLGTAVRAPDDLSGDWTVQWDQSPTNAPSSVMRIQQSGRFFRVQIGQDEPLSLTLDRAWRGRREGRLLQMRLHGAVWTMDVSGDIPMSNPMQIPMARVELSGPAKYVGIARRGKQEGAALDNPAAKAKPAETANAR